jgi:hypothetical protein
VITAPSTRIIGAWSRFHFEASAPMAGARRYLRDDAPRNENGAGECTCMPIFLANEACKAHPLRQIPCIVGDGIGDRLCSLEEGGFFGLSPSFTQRIPVGARR